MPWMPRQDAIGSHSIRNQSEMSQTVILPPVAFQSLKLTIFQLCRRAGSSFIVLSPLSMASSNSSSSSRSQGLMSA